MKDELNPNDIENQDSTLNNDENDYENLITRLKNMKQIIALIEELYLEKF